MFGRKTLLLPFVLVVICCARAPLARAQRAVSAEQDTKSAQNQPYNLASIDGEYAIVGTFSGSIAGGELGIVRFRDGQFSGYLTNNLPGTTPADRSIYRGSFTGTSTINDDGSGVATVTVTFANNTSIEVHLDTLITKAREVHGRKVALEIHAMQRESTAGEFLVQILTRRPD